MGKLAKKKGNYENDTPDLPEYCQVQGCGRPALIYIRRSIDGRPSENAPIVAVRCAVHYARDIDSRNLSASFGQVKPDNPQHDAASAIVASVMRSD